ncbi:hypothetical protein [Feifania hominis]|uniref:Uncharacterized protein n=1 Tax=Feifania hominis TaxID=2763660 RepID=A0A926DE16_9FIRM|nr:hypothetical protein [Feifania hominis]MBC8536888.1 hypothetical protein [Feifania hominis]
MKGGEHIAVEIRVSCLVERYWDLSTRQYAGQQKQGTLIAVSSQTDDGGQVEPVGIVMLDDGKWESVPIAFIQREQTN